jgi:hypothetical protein
LRCNSQKEELFMGNMTNGSVKTDVDDYEEGVDGKKRRVLSTLSSLAPMISQSNINKIKKNYGTLERKEEGEGTNCHHCCSEMAMWWKVRQERLLVFVLDKLEKRSQWGIEHRNYSNC